MLTIGDSAPMPVVFDTGTTEDILDAALAKRVGLKVVGHFNLVESTAFRVKSGHDGNGPEHASPRPRRIARHSGPKRIFDAVAGT